MSPMLYTLMPFGSPGVMVQSKEGERSRVQRYLGNGIQERGDSVKKTRARYAVGPWLLGTSCSIGWCWLEGVGYRARIGRSPKLSRNCIVVYAPFRGRGGKEQSCCD